MASIPREVPSNSSAVVGPMSSADDKLIVSAQVLVGWCRLFGSARVRFVKSHGGLKLVGVTAADNGVYSCRAVNPAGQLDSTDNFVLNVPGEERRSDFVSLLIHHSRHSRTLSLSHSCPVRKRAYVLHRSRPPLYIKVNYQA